MDNSSLPPRALPSLNKISSSLSFDPPSSILSSSGHRGGSADRGRRSVGVMELVDEVRECKYSDVHVMWTILKETEKRRQQAAAMASAINHT
ncbi:hypothetical protein V2J09_010288 [Rumex salicifolius]